MATLNPLISAAELEERLGEESLRVADCRFYLAEPSRGRQEYAANHIPGSRYFSLDDDLTGVVGAGLHPLPSATAFGDFIGRSGIGPAHNVVVYDDAGGGIAARMWWMLRSLGHDRVRVLDGGWENWMAESRPTTRQVPQWPAIAFTGGADWTGVITAEQIEVARSDVLLIDARESERYRGDVEPIDPVAGHIPGAISVPYVDNVGPQGRFLPLEDLESRFAATVDSDRKLVGYCGSGVTACSNLLALAAIGRTDALLYPGSWSDWCTSGRPVATAP